MTMATARRPERVAVIDDREAMRDVLSEDLADEGFTPRPLNGPFPEIAGLVHLIKDEADAAVCDQELVAGSYASFTGAEAVAELYRARIPALLVTQFREPDLVRIRQYRWRVPVLLDPEEAQVTGAISDGLNRTRREIEGDYATHRRPWRTLVRVEQLNRAANPQTVSLVVPAWSPSEQVEFPISMFPPGFIEEVIQNSGRFFAQVNIGTEQAEDLYIDPRRENLRVLEKLE